MTMWESVEKMKLDLMSWLTSKRAELDQLKEKPVKLHVEPAQQDVQVKQLENTRCDIMSVVVYENEYIPHS